MSVIYINSYQFAVAAYDPDAANYIAAVETADGQSLEAAVKDAINAFVIGCKSDGIWSAIKASCILAGARTLNGALQPLAGTAPTNYNFVAGDYNRKAGLIGDGSTKYLGSNRASNADPQDSQHIAVQITAQSAGGINSYFIAAGDFQTSGSSALQTASSNSNMSTRSRNSSGITHSTKVAGFFGLSRSSPSSYNYRYGGTTAISLITSQSPVNLDYFIFNTNPGYVGSANPSNARLAFYSIGEALDLAKLDARVTTLINAFSAAIP